MRWGAYSLWGICTLVAPVLLDHILQRKKNPETKHRPAPQATYGSHAKREGLERGKRPRLG
ncbi:hypothetical protein NEOLEDRAFT_786209 [Neolentinus lepideus HHB14362 ss-1]|uniref:Uncharacterized protein n=1 Tax=Neolentinus lepideus HHB14362 ss-1 TaxID=1314782 RepID=A0A165UYB8_9AGAM|nr:hypothetical protein NEOLEDRAFT_786209 [Neolentinus lepideus HHB14362 ss-1]